MALNDDERIHERILLLKHCFYYDSLGEDASIKFMNQRMEENDLKKVNTFQEAAYLLTDSELSKILNGLPVVFPFKGQYYTFKNNHLYIQQDSSDRVLADLDRVLRIYKEDAWTILKILTSVDKIDLDTLKKYCSQVSISNIDYTQLLGELQNNYQLITSEIIGNQIIWKVPNEIKTIISTQLDRIDDFNQLMEKIPKTLTSETVEQEETRKPSNKGKTYIDLSEVLELIKEDRTISQSPELKKDEKKIKKKEIEKKEIEGKSITVEGWIKKILKNDITFRTEDGQEVRFTCNRPELIAFCIGHINKQLRFYFDVKAAELVCQKVEVAD
ncbi:MAG: hypothetical protein ACTSWR_12390 [Candidatus Helarchaeota archaeon]